MADAPTTRINIPVASISKDLTVQVKLVGLRRWHLRLRLGVWLMQFAIWVAGMGCEVEPPQHPDLPDPNRPSLEVLERTSGVSLEGLDARHRKA